MATELRTKVELTFSCSDLKSLDTFSKSDPEVYVFTKINGVWQLLGTTEKIKNCANPKFTRAVTVNYMFEETQAFRFAVYDIDSKDANLSQQDFIGELYCNLSDIICSSKLFTKDLVHPKHLNSKRGSISIHSEEIKDLKQDVRLAFSGHKLDKKDVFGKSDPYLKIYKTTDTGQYILIRTTEIIKNTLEPNWAPFVMPVAELTGGDKHRLIKVECFDWDAVGTHDLIGIAQVTLTQLLDPKSREFSLVNPEIVGKKKGYVDSGKLVVKESTIIPQYSFLDYLYGGCEISLILAIDFTASNQDPKNPQSLHYTAPNQYNQYQQAILSVGNILAPYDTDQRFPVYGFGARIGGNVTHCFPLNGNPQNPEVPGIQGMLDVYSYAIHNCELYGPTIFSKIIDVAAQISSRTETQENQKYYILLIITDGAINDEADTIREVVRISRLPLSIVIVGVGQADFSLMTILDSDKALLTDSNGVTAARDIVQFVAFRDYMGANFVNLPRDTLKEIPDQILKFMQYKNFVPNPRRSSPLPNS